MLKRKIAVFTGNRAEYGLLYSLIHEIDKSDALNLDLIVTGGHLDPNFGNTIEEIKKDGFSIAGIVDLKYESGSSFEVSQAISSCIAGMSEVLDQLKPDILVVYADRFEGFGAVIAASQMNIPVAHVEGGDLTEGGALDDSVRHAMTKLSHIHFTTNGQARNRVLAMGEERWRVADVGFPGLDGLASNDFESEELVLKFLDFSSKAPIVLFTQHSITTEPDKAQKQIQQSLSALEKLILNGVQVVATYPNNDWGGEDIVDALLEFNSKRYSGFRLIPSLGRRRYHGLLNLARNKNYKIVCVGNSSSGLKETPAFGCPTVNIGNRQKGRLSASNIINCGNNADKIYAAVNKCLSDKIFRESCYDVINPYGIGDSGKKMHDYLRDVTLGDDLLKKRMILAGEENKGWFR
jgi:UDP-hydrolysing UDP-N-acetyl-D-glucosamine 2-epimerase